MLLTYADGRLKASKENIIKALEGNWRNEQLFNLRIAWEHYKFLLDQLAQCDKETEKTLTKFETCETKKVKNTTAYLQEYYNAMLLRDIIEYNQLSNYHYLRSLYRQAASSIGKTISIRRLYNHLKSQQYHVGINSIYDVMDMAENAYLFKRISRFDYSGSKREKSDKKIYWLDNGLLNANTAQYTENKGLLLENAVFRALYSRFGSIYENNLYYYAEPTAECDFIVYPEGGTALPVQVSWTLTDPATRQREIKGLLKACAYCRVKEAWIITNDEEEELTIEGIHISVKSAWKWLLT